MKKQLANNISIEALTKLPADVRNAYIERNQYIEELEAIVESYGADPLKELYSSLMYQVARMSKDIRRAEVSIDGDDKQFDRFIKLNDSLKKILENLDYLGLKSGAKQEEQEKKRRNPIEERAAKVK